MSQDDRLEMARVRARELRDLHSHLVVFGAAMALLAVLDALTGGGWWVQWPLAGWGVGLAAHAVTLWGRRRWGPEWEDRKVTELLKAGAPHPAR